MIVNGPYISMMVLSNRLKAKTEQIFYDYPKSLLIEKIPQKSYNILNLEDNGIGDNTGIRCSKDHYFFMGDNRDNPLDSFLDQVGYVSYEI